MLVRGLAAAAGRLSLVLVSEALAALIPVEAMESTALAQA